jgi:hypothetical protein
MKIFSPHITGSLEVVGNSTMTGSLTVTGGITGSFSGTASFATNAITASFSQNSEVITVGGGGSELFVTMVDSTGIDGKYTIRQSITGAGALTYNDTAGAETLKTRFFQGALIGNADTATSSSFATSASFAQTASFALNAPASNPFPFTGSAIISGSLEVTGSFRGLVQTLTVSSNTASIDCNTGNFFKLTIPGASTTQVVATNITPGQTINVLFEQESNNSGSITFPSYFKFAGGYDYEPTLQSGSQDIVSMVAFNATNLYTVSVKNLL